MICPKCAYPESDVVECRKRKDYNYRRRKCSRCGVIFSSIEIVEINETNLTKIRTLMKDRSKPRQFEKVISLMYLKCYHYYKYRKIKMTKGRKRNENRSTAVK